MTPHAERQGTSLFSSAQEARALKAWKLSFLGEEPARDWLCIRKGRCALLEGGRNGVTLRTRRMGKNLDGKNFGLGWISGRYNWFVCAFVVECSLNRGTDEMVFNFREKCRVRGN